MLKYISFIGYDTRTEYWIVQITLQLLLFFSGSQLAQSLVVPYSGSILIKIFYLVAVPVLFLWAYLASIVRRLRDAGIHLLSLFLFLGLLGTIYFFEPIRIAVLIVLIYWGCVPSEE